MRVLIRDLMSIGVNELSLNKGSSQTMFRRLKPHPTTSGERGPSQESELNSE
jgi:hypothetical protein